jgi:hypothetical protein
MKEIRYVFEPPEVNRAFSLLEAQLAKTILPTEAGTFRQVCADEFMLMHQDTEIGAYAFKHRDTRNYVFLLPLGHGSYELYVPRTHKPFMQGFFDSLTGRQPHNLPRTPVIHNAARN